MGKLQLKIDGNDFTGVLADNPVIKDQLNACCRTLTFKLDIFIVEVILDKDLSCLYTGTAWTF